ncbi:TIM barrel protein [candidate division KSB1 bacterium]|nr:TIM barrel protein [candidate division KSB1 bacterium]
MSGESSKEAIPRRQFIRGAAAAAGLSLATGSASLLAKSGSDLSISVFSKHLQWLDYNDMARMASDIGFDAVDLTVRRNGHVLPENVERDLPRAVDAVRQQGLDVVMMTTQISDAFDPTSEKILATASQLGIKYYRMAWLKYDDQKSVKDNHLEFKKQLIALQELNERYKIKGAYQNHAGKSLGSAVWDLGMLLKEINSPWLGCQYDIRHATIEGANAWPIGFEYISPFINTMDIKDFYWEKIDNKWNIVNCPLGEGMVDWSSFVDKVRQFNIAAPLCIHYEYDLGGAEHGDSRLAISKETFMAALLKDLEFTRQLFKS